MELEGEFDFIKLNLNINKIEISLSIQKAHIYREHRNELNY